MEVIKILTLKYWEDKFFYNKYTEVKTIQKINYFVRLISKSGKVLGRVYFDIKIPFHRTVQTRMQFKHEVFYTKKPINRIYWNVYTWPRASIAITIVKKEMNMIQMTWITYNCRKEK